MLKTLAGMTFLFGTIAATTQALAAGCGNRDVVVKRLESKYSEGLSAAGLQATAGAQGSVLEIWSSEETGTFTVILTNAQGVSCILAAGTDWFQQIPVAKAPGIQG